MSEQSTAKDQPSNFMTEDGIRLDQETIGNAPSRIRINAAELHVVAGCSDSRDVSEAFNRAVKEVRRRFAEKGIYIHLQRETVAGSFMTPDVVHAMKRGIRGTLDDFHPFYKNEIPINMYVHVLTHGAVTRKAEADPKLRFTLHELQMNHDSPVNCGMMHAEEVAEELEQELLLKQARLTLPNFTRDGERRRVFTITNQEDVKDFMEAAYGVRTLIAAGWVRSIADVRHHAYEQKAILRGAFNADEFKNLHIHLTAGVQNYEDNGYYRVDGNLHLPNTFIDQVFALKREMLLSGGIQDHGSRIVGQKPDFGLFHHSDIDHPRATAVALFAPDKPYNASMVFSIGSGLAERYERAFGSYRIIGFYYAVRHLHLKDWVVIGKDERQTERMLARINNDPLISWVIGEHGVTLHPYSHQGINHDELGGVSGSGK